MSLSILIINFKNYPQAVGKAGVELAKMLEVVAKDFPQVEVVLAVSPVDVFQVSQAIDISVFSQYIGPLDTDRMAVSAIPERLKEVGAVGSLINHSEHPMSLDMMVPAVRRCRKVGLKTVVCVDSVEIIRELKGCLEGAREGLEEKKGEGVRLQAVDEFKRSLSKKFKKFKKFKEFKKFNPDFYAYEPPELIGGEISVTTAEPEAILQAVETAQPTPLLVGAGVHAGEDVQVALKLGAVGVLVSSDIVTSENPGGELRELLGGFESKLEIRRNSNSQTNPKR